MRYNPSTHIVNPTPNFHTITLDLASTVDYSNSTGGLVNFNTIIRVEVKKWDTTTNTYVSYSPQRLMTYNYVRNAVPPGTISVTLASPGWVITNPTGPTANTLECTYGDALYVLIADGGPYPTVFDQHISTIITSPDPSSDFSCSLQPPYQVGPGPMGHSLVPYGSSFYYASKSIITEDYIITTATVSTRI